MGEIIYNGRSSATYGIKIWSAPNYELPERDEEVYHIPGRSGDLVISTGSYKNVDRAYTISSGSDEANFYDLARQIANWMNSTSTYAVLQDTYDPQYYRVALPPKVNEISSILGHAALATITFNCKPQRYLVSGDTKTTYTSFPGSITNPTQYASRPVLYFYGSSGGSGSLTINGHKVEINGALHPTTALVVDCELQECYMESANMSANVVLESGFPILKTGSNVIGSKSGSITKLEVQPKWWIL